MGTPKRDWSEYLITAVSDPSGTGSQMPNDEFTWTDASNYGLDGFHHEQTMGEGTREKGSLAKGIVPAQAKGMSALPDGFIGDTREADDLNSGFSFADEDEGLFDIGDMLSPEEGSLPVTAAERHAVSLVSLDWLDPTQEQDPERLPKELRPDQPPLHSVPELEEAWGVHRRTDGLTLVPNKDREAILYEQSIESDVPATPGVEKSADDIAWHIKKAVRMSHYGQSMGEIVNYLHANLSAALARKATGVIAVDHGVAGNVFIRASAFPGLKNGKWASQIKKLCRTARYVITDDPAVAVKLSMQMVKDVPYHKALREYLPRLEAAGYKVAKVGANPKKTLQLAFLTGPVAVEHVPSIKPVEVRPVDTVSLAEAKQVAAATPRQVQQVIVRDDRVKARIAALAMVKRAAQAGLISQSDALRLFQSKASPEVIRKTAEAIARAYLMPKTASYGGVGTRMTEHRQAKQVRDHAWAKLAQAELAEDRMRKAHGHVAKMVTTGQLTAKEASKATAEATPEMVLKVAAAYANASGYRKTKLAATQTREYDGQRMRRLEPPEQTPKAAPIPKPVPAPTPKVKPAPVPVGEYKGPLLRQAALAESKAKELSVDEAAMRQASSESGIKVAEFRSMARWVRQKMSEGMAGDDLTALVNVRFASPLRTAAVNLIAEIRKEHEGLSGHLYVDAEAYASKTGSGGCEKAAPLHRANQVPFVKAMPRCSSCVMANSNGTCTKYGKELLYQLPKDAAAFKQQMIHMANAPDHEVTASLFDPQEFNLTSPMASLEIEDPTVTEDIGNVLFGDGLIL